VNVYSLIRAILIISSSGGKHLPAISLLLFLPNFGVEFAIFPNSAVWLRLHATCASGFFGPIAFLDPEQRVETPVRSFFI
jgi:hypothetical protein